MTLRATGMDSIAPSSASADRFDPKPSGRHKEGGAQRHGLHAIGFALETARLGGASDAECLHESGIQPPMLDEPSAEVEAWQEYVVLRNILRLTGPKSPCGLMTGARFHLTSFGLLGLAMASCSSLRAAFELNLRHLELTPAFSRFNMEGGSDRVSFVIDDRDIPVDLQRLIVEAETMVTLTVQRELIGAEEPFPVREVHFRFAAPAYADVYLDFLGVIPRFGQPRNQIIMDSAILDRQPPMANHITAKLCESLCSDMVAMKRSRLGVAGQVREYVTKGRERVPSSSEIARRLCITPRTLQRKLATEGTSFRRLVKEVRVAQAVDLLSAPRMTVERVAEQLGYSDTSAFIRAFKRWSGDLPTSFRRV